jgi:hypothetical protein
MGSVDRPSKARRRFHTDRIVRNRRRRVHRESPDLNLDSRSVAYGRLAQQDPWDCGHPGCGVCNPRDLRGRDRERLQWRADWEL